MTQSDDKSSLTREELFAAMAMQGLLASDPTAYRHTTLGRLDHELLTEDALRCAKSMIKTLNKFGALQGGRDVVDSH